MLNASRFPTCAEAASGAERRTVSQAQSAVLGQWEIFVTREQKCLWPRVARKLAPMNVMRCSERGESLAAACENVAAVPRLEPRFGGAGSVIGTVPADLNLLALATFGGALRTKGSVEVVVLKGSPNARVSNDVVLCWDANFTGSRGTKSPKRLDLTRSKSQ